jgi:hypothetical protein
MGQINQNTGLTALNDNMVFAVFIAVHMNLVETTPEETKDIDTSMKNLIETGFADGSMNCSMSQDDIQEYL